MRRAGSASTRRGEAQSYTPGLSDSGTRLRSRSRLSRRREARRGTPAEAEGGRASGPGLSTTHEVGPPRGPRATTGTLPRRSRDSGVPPSRSTSSASAKRECGSPARVRLYVEGWQVCEWCDRVFAARQINARRCKSCRHLHAPRLHTWHTGSHGDPAVGPLHYLRQCVSCGRKVNQAVASSVVRLCSECRSNAGRQSRHRTRGQARDAQSPP